MIPQLLKELQVILNQKLDSNQPSGSIKINDAIFSPIKRDYDRTLRAKSSELEQEHSITEKNATEHIMLSKKFLHPNGGLCDVIDLHSSKTCIS